MKITYLTHFFPPEVGSSQSRVWEMCQRLLRSGNDVNVITTFPHFPLGRIFDGYRNKLIVKEQLDGLPVHRTYTFAAANKGFAFRLMDHLAFCASSLVATPYVRGTEALIVDMPPLFLSGAARVMARLLGAKLVLNIADLWPESAIEIGVLSNRSIIGALMKFTKSLYRRCDLIFVTANGQGDVLRSYGVDPGKIVFVPNGVDTNLFTPGPSETDFGRKHGLLDKFVVLYGGMLGMAHGLDNVVKAANILREHNDIAFLLVGDGAERDNLETLSRELKTDNVVFMDLMPKHKMPEILRSCDAGLVHLRKLPVFDKVLPSKTFEIMASAKPVLCVVGGEAAEVINNSSSGIVVPQEDPAALADAVLALRNDAASCSRMGKGGRRYVEKHHSRDVIVQTFESAIRATVEGKPQQHSLRPI